LGRGSDLAAFRRLWAPDTLTGMEDPAPSSLGVIASRALAAGVMAVVGVIVLGVCLAALGVPNWWTEKIAVGVGGAAGGFFGWRNHKRIVDLLA